MSGHRAHTPDLAARFCRQRLRGRGHARHTFDRAPARTPACVLAMAALMFAGCGPPEEARLRVSEDASLLATPGVQDVVRQAGFGEQPEGIIYDPPTPLVHPDSARAGAPR